jgi:hypothetical protein
MGNDGVQEMTGSYDLDFEIGFDINSTSNYAALLPPVHYPKTAYHPYAATVDLDDLTQRGMGLPSVVQSWTTITQEERDMLRTFCPGASAPVVIHTRTNDDSAEFLYYTCTMVWPSLAEEYDARTRQAFAITFRNMILTSPPA